MSNANQFAAWSPRLLSVLRFFAGLLFLQFGLAKIVGFPHVDMFANMQLMSLVGASGIIELVGGALLTVGLFTRPAAFILSGEMAVAYFLEHAPHNFFPALNGGAFAIFACFTFLYIAATGGGPWSLDAMMRRR